MTASFPVFTCHHTLGELDGWPIDSHRVEQLYLPLIGPTPYCLLRALHEHLSEAAESGWGRHGDYLTADLADSLGVAPKRVVASLYRLMRYGLIFEDQLDTTYEKPTFIVPGRVVPLGEQHWARLPVSVRARYAEVEL